jgi:hypothetical protein
MSKVLLVLDMDDTLCDTQSEVVIRLRRKLYDRAAWEDLMWVYDSFNANRIHRTHSTMLYPPHLRDIINTEIIQEAGYIKTVKPTTLVTDGKLGEMITRLRAQLGDDLKTIIGTHRNGERNVFEDTIDWLDRANFSQYIDNFHFISNTRHRNKIEYLESFFPEYKIVLLDDNPFGDLHTVHEPNESVLVYQELCTYDAYTHQNKFKSVDILADMIMDLAR